jgi:hypothetical protein
MILRDLAVATNVWPDFRLVQNLREVESLCLPMLHSFLRLQHVGASDHFIERAETELRHEFADFLGDERHEVHRVFRIASEFLT